MNKIKTWLILIFVLLFVGFAYAFLTKEQAPQISTTPIPKPEIPKTFEGEHGVVIEVEEKNFDFPNTLPVLNATPSTISEEESKKIANNLGFNFEPSIVPDVFEGKKHSYSGDDYVLLIALKVGKIDYERNLILGEIANKQLSDGSILKIAEDFLVQNELVTPEEVSPLAVSYFKSDEGAGIFKTQKENATFFQVNFSTKISDVPVITLNPQNSPAYVRVLTDGTILKAHVEKLGQVTQSDQVYRMKNYDEVISSKEGAILISLDEGNVYLPDLNSSAIKQITITEIELAYLIEPSPSRTLQPIFLLKGTADVSGLGGEVKAVLYLPAISEAR